MLEISKGFIFLKIDEQTGINWEGGIFCGNSYVFGWMAGTTVDEIGSDGEG